MTSTPRTLLLLRHATAERSHPGGHDADRRLSALGRTEAAGVGAFLRGSGLQVDHVLCSPAVRTRETLEQLALGSGTETPVVDLVPRLYAAGPEELVELLSGLTATTVLVVGHAPAVPEAVALLAGPGSSPGAGAAIASRYPPGTLTHLRSGRGVLGAKSAVLIAVRLPDGRDGEHFD